ncbi:MAG: peptide chain release factor N(5)-glutamine methyltransferase, partial [Muribaculaceae bacterium]|nr:peptide chain release factor N(5)-glutamine methyltransferase [Muribaculaceae bacterium]
SRGLGVVYKSLELPPFIPEKIDGIIRRLLDDEPLQYIVGEARFCGLTLKVTPDVLIPRPETEELVDIITRQWKEVPDLSVLDLCTGSGCIAVALARSLRFPAVTAVDISAPALAVARANIAGLRVKVEIINGDILAMKPDHARYDVIVSNPPYVAEHERAGMPPNVVGKEPDLALFVPDNDPLRFYKAIAAYASEALTPRGTLYLEINPLYAADLSRMLELNGFSDINILPDFNGLKRFAIARR